MGVEDRLNAEHRTNALACISFPLPVLLRARPEVPVLPTVCGRIVDQSVATVLRPSRKRLATVTGCNHEPCTGVFLYGLTQFFFLATTMTVVDFVFHLTFSIFSKSRLQKSNPTRLPCGFAVDVQCSK